MREPVIGIMAIASTLLLRRTAPQQNVQAHAAGGRRPGNLPSPGEGPAATTGEPTPLAGGGPGTLPSPTATAPAAQPSRSAKIGESYGRKRCRCSAAVRRSVQVLHDDYAHYPY